MNNSADNEVIVLRITALWAFTEAGLGGVLHLFKTPFSGLMLCGLSIIYLSMIAKYSGYSARVIIKSLLLVVFIKMLVSPHSGITAYFAVLFQGFLAALIFGTLRDSLVGLYLFGIIAMVESAMQRLIVLTVLFGMQFWEAVNEFGVFVYQIFFSGSPQGNWFSWTVVILYLLLYAAGGAFAAKFYTRISKRMQSIENRFSKNLELETSGNIDVFLKKTKAKGKNRKAWGLLAALLIFTIVFSTAISDLSGVVYILIRSLLIIVLWVYVFNPLFFYLLKKILKKRFEDERERARNIQSLFPWIKIVLSESWGRSSHLAGMTKFENFLSWTFFFFLKK